MSILRYQWRTAHGLPLVFLGTDVYVRLPKLVSLLLLLLSQVVCNRALKGTNLEGIEV